MLKLRLRRVGRKHDPSFRIVVTEATAPVKGKYLESVGFYNARLKQISLDKDRITHWLSVGIQPTDTVHNILVKEGIIEGKKIAVHSRKPSKKKAVKQAEDAKNAEAAPKPEEGEAPKADAAAPEEEKVEEKPAEEESKEEEKEEGVDKTEEKE